MAEIDTSKTVSELEIDGVNVQLAGSGGGTELPAYMSAKNFTFDGNSCTGYVGDNSLPEIIIPKSYSTVTSIETVVGAKVLDKENLSMSIYDFQSTTFSDGGTNTQTYTSTSQLQNLSTDFPNDCYLVSMEVLDVFNFDFLNLAYDMQILQFPININGQSFSDGMAAFDYIIENNITDVNFGGDVEIITFIDGDDYQVTSVSRSGIDSGFKNYQNRIILLSNLTSIGNYAFYGCSSLASIEIPSSVVSIGEGTFSYCSNLTSIDIPSGVTSIGNYTFRGCSALETVTFGDNSQLESIEGYAFDDCFNLTSITLPSSLTSIGQGAFNNCSSLTSIEIPSSVIKIRDRAFAGTPWFANLQNTSYGIATASDGQTRFVIDVPTDITDDELDMTNVKVIADDAFDDCTNLASITIPDSVTSIGSSAFTGCSSLEKVNITDIDAWAMIDFTSSSANPLYYGAELYLNGELVTQVTLSIATKIEDYAFYSCNSLTSITIPSVVTSIGNYTFDGCRSLTSATIPSSVTSIGWGVFEDCSSLTTMRVEATTPPTLQSTNAISTATKKIYIPAGTLSAYQSATNWSNFASLFEELPQ